MVAESIGDWSQNPQQWLAEATEWVTPKVALVAEYLPAIGAGTAIVVAVLAVTRGTLVRRVRARRRTVALKPSSNFDPSAEEILRFCGQLARVRRATSRLLVPASAHAVRVSLVSAGEGRMAHLLSGPAEAEKLWRRQGLAQVELADPSSVLGPRSGVVSESATAESRPSQAPPPERGANAAEDLVEEPPVRWSSLQDGEWV